MSKPVLIFYFHSILCYFRILGSKYMLSRNVAAILLKIDGVKDGGHVVKQFW